LGEEKKMEVDKLSSKDDFQSWGLEGAGHQWITFEEMTSPITFKI
jgi:hypothetical protein